MTRQPFDPAELGTDDPALQPVADALERYARDAGGSPPAGLAPRIRGALGHEPIPRRGWLAGLIGWGASGPRRGLVPVVAGLVVAAAVAVALVGVQVAGLLRDVNLGSSPSPAPAVTTSPSPTPSPTLSPSPTPSPSVSPIPSPSASPDETPAATSPALPLPTASDDEGGGHSGPGGGEETPQPTEAPSDD